MNTKFKTLFTAGVEHGYYKGSCQDVLFVIPAETARWLRNGKLLARTIDGRLHVLFETDEEGTVRSAIPDKVLRFGLLAGNPNFPNITQPDADFAETRRLYRNAAVPTALDAPKGVTLAGRMLSHVLTVLERPVTLTLKDSSSQPLQSGVITAAESRASISYDLTGYPPGAYQVEEVSAGGAVPTNYYSEPELAQAGVFGILEVTVASSFYTALTPTAFKITFEARKETLNYYVVATAKDASDLATLAITDEGAAEDERDPVLFEKFESDAFPPKSISPALLGDSSKQVVLFRSLAEVPRSEKARRNIQLMKSTEILIKHLPQPGPGKANADIIIPVSKP